MKTSPCPNCDGKSLYQSSEVCATGPYGPNLLPGLGGIFKSAKFHAIVCRDCGLMRLFASREAMEKLAESRKWKQVDGST